MKIDLAVPFIGKHGTSSVGGLCGIARFNALDGAAGNLLRARKDNAVRNALSVLWVALFTQGSGYAAEVWLSCRMESDAVACTENQPMGQIQDQWIVPYHRPPPEYPRSLRDRGLEGCALIGFTVTEQGETTDIRRLESGAAEQFAAAAKDAVKRYRFHPLKAAAKGVAVNLCFSLS